MPICVKCGFDVCKPCRLTGELSPRIDRVIVASDTQLCRVSHFQRLAMGSKALDIPRRAFPNWLADVIFGCDGQIVWGSGERFVILDTAIDDAFNNDGSFRWLSDFLDFAETPPRQRPQERVLCRLRLIDLAFRIAYPERARWIAQ